MLTPSSTRKAESEGSLLLRSSISGLPALLGRSAAWTRSWGGHGLSGGKLSGTAVVWSGQMSRELCQPACLLGHVCAGRGVSGLG